MKKHSECLKAYIGTSDIACLVLVGCKSDSGVSTELLRFGGDSSYHAYLADEETIIPEHYELISTFNHWIKIYDDTDLIWKTYAKEIRVYRAEAYGTIIQVIKEV